MPELFVPLRVRDGERGAADEKAPAWTTSELLSRLVARGEEPARFVVLGDPGSGKTTLCRFLAVVLAGEVTFEGVEIVGEPLPLFLPFRDYVRLCREEGDRDLLTYLVDQARNHLQVVLTREDLEAALGQGDAILVLDGLDEVGGAGEREEMRERVQAFCRAWSVPVLVTSRVAGYDEAPLPDGPGGFRRVRLEPFDDPDLELFVVRWYSAQEPEDPRARDEGIAELRAALASDERVRELARNPMLATLIALVHRFEAHLPGERAKLYDLCVKTLLETWPAARRRRFRDIDEGLQRAYLEELAYALQQKRSDPRGEVTVERAELVALLTGVVARDRGIHEEVARGVVERWVTFLQEGTGLLVEQRPGVFAFLHLSLMEYLAARGWDHAADLAEGIASRFSSPVWREVCLLGIGSRATDRGFLARIFKQLTDRGLLARIFKRLAGRGSETDVWGFLLAALTEEAAFDEGQCDRIAAAVARMMFKEGRDNRQQLFARLRRLSRRHRDWAERWIISAVRKSRGDELVRVVLLAGRDAEATVSTLRNRLDAAEAAAGLLDLAPMSASGRWAHAAAPPSAVDRWWLSTAEELVPGRCLFALCADSPRYSTRPATTATLRSAIRFARFANEAIARLAVRKRPGGKGVPATVTALPWHSRAKPVLCFTRAAVAPAKQRAVASPDYIARDFSCGLAYDFAYTFVRDFASSLAGAFVRDLGDSRVARWLSEGYARDLAFSFAADFSQAARRRLRSAFGWNLVRDLAYNFPHAFTRDFVLDCVRNSASFFIEQFARDDVFPHDHEFALDFDGEAVPWRQRASPRLASPIQADLALGLACGSGWARGHEPTAEEFCDYVSLLFARLVIETWVALVTTVGRRDDERGAYFARRIQNAWLLHVWPLLDHHLDRDPHPDRLALYLALGWSQATTTWLWPGTPRWIEILGGPPPAEWRPRATWHLCWLLHDPESPVHVAGLRGALAEGRAEDPEDLLIAALEDASGLSAAD